MLLIMGAQFGIALAASVVVHPILLNIKKTSALEIFNPFFYKTHKSVITMSMIVTLLALVISIMSGNWLWLIATIIMHLNAPYTYFILMPVNRRLLDKKVDPDSKQTNTDLVNWGKIHAFRTLLNGLTLLFLIVLAVCTI